MNAPLKEQFADWLAGRPWELALLQEAPPRWLAALGRRSGASGALALTSRNSFAPLRALLADWNPDLIGSNEGGSNQLLVRAPWRILDLRRLTLATRPERRRMLWARVAIAGGGALAVANLHASADDPLAAARDVELAAERAVEWAGHDPLVLGGDLNVRPGNDDGLFERLSDRFGLGPPPASRAIDHLLARGLEVVEPPAVLPAREREVSGPAGLTLRLSDHAPVVASFGMR